MSDRDQFLDAVARGALIRPRPDQMDFVDVVRAVVHAAGITVTLNDHNRRLAGQLAQVDHIVFLMADGLGYDFVDQLPPTSWTRRHTHRWITAPYPSTTTNAVTSIFTGERPTAHGVIGWWTHLPELPGPATVFAHDRATDGRPLANLGLGVETICPLPPAFPRMSRLATLVVPENIVESPYTIHMAGPCGRIGYQRYDEAVDAILEVVEQSHGPTLTYWYTSSPDAEAHELGCQHERVFQAIALLDAAAERLAASLSAGIDTWALVGTADHGHRELSPKLELETDHPLLTHLLCPPAGDMRIQYWHVRRGAEESFCSLFRQKLGQHFFLLTAEELEELELLGSEPWSETTRQRVGTHVSVSRGSAALRFAGIPGGSGYRRMQSGHSGLTPAEMRVPLIIDGDYAREQDYPR